MSTADKLNKLLETKEAIKQAIIDKGGTVGDVFAEYPTAIQNIQGGGGTCRLVVPKDLTFGYSSITEFPEDWDWSEFEQATDQHRRFYSCQNLIKSPKLKITNATDISEIYYGCDISEIDMSEWDLSKATQMRGMFDSCGYLKSVNWGTFDTSSNKNFQNMFKGCQNLEAIPELDCSSNTSTYSKYTTPLYGCTILRNFGGMKGIKTSIYFDEVYCLSYESALNIINGLSDGVSGQTLTLYKDVVNQLSDDDIAIAINKGWTVSPAKTITSPILVTDKNQVTGVYQITPRVYDFSQYTGIISINTLRYFEGDVSKMQTYGGFQLNPQLRWAKLKTNIAGSTESMFSQCGQLQEITGLEGYTTNADSMFLLCSYLEYIDLSKLDTSQCTSMKSMFERTLLKEIPTLNTSQCTDMTYMFFNTPIITADLRGWDLSKVTTMFRMFGACHNLQTVYMDSDIRDLSDDDIFYNVTTEGTFYYNPAYDYSTIIAQLPATWTAVPLTE